MPTEKDTRPTWEGILVVPCYNEARRLDTRAFERFAARDATFAFLFVDDGSTDETPQVLKDLCGSNPQRFFFHQLSHNSGKAEAVRTGILLAVERNPQYVGFWDADLATPLSAAKAMAQVLRKRAGVLAVIGARVRMLGRTIERRWKRHYAGRVFATCASLILGVSVYDTQCGAKLFRVTPEVIRAFAQPFRTRWIFDVELLARLLCGSAPGPRPSQQNQMIFEYPLRQWRDVAGSKLRLRHVVKAALDLGGILVRYRWSRGGRPAAAKETVRGGQDVVPAAPPLDRPT